MTNLSLDPDGEAQAGDHGTDAAILPRASGTAGHRPIWIYFVAVAGLVILIFFAIGAALNALDNRSQETKKQTFAVTAAPRLLVTADVGGSIQVRPGNDNAVNVQ